MAEAKQLVLPAVTTLVGDPFYNLQATIRSQFDEVVLLDEGGSVKATIINGQNQKKETKVGTANVDYICALLLGTTGGRGNNPSGAILWAAEHAPEVQHLSQYTIKAVPSSRGNILEGPVSAFMDVVRTRAAILGPSLEKYPPEKTKREKEIGNEPEEIEVEL